MRAVLSLLMLSACGRVGFDDRADADAGDGNAACVIDLAVGNEHACALLDDGGVWCWGRNDRGQLGRGDVTDAVFAPARTLEGPYTQLVAGNDMSCGLRREDGSVECWGNDGNDQLGPLASGASGTPVLVTGVAGEELIAGSASVCVRQGGTVSCWGDNDAGELGSGMLSDRREQPLPITLTGVTVPTGGGDHMCMGTATGVACWGVNSDGQLGVDPAATTDVCMDNSDQSQPCSLAPVMLSAFPSGVSAIGIGNAFTCALAGGVVKCWGHGEFQELGDGLSIKRSMPAPVATISNVVAISIGKASGCATQSDSTVWCWGEGSEGQHGNGMTTDEPAPVMAPKLTGAKMITTGPSSRVWCAVQGEKVRCWGDNQYGVIAGAASPDVLEPTPVIPRCP